MQKKMQKEVWLRPVKPVKNKLREMSLFFFLYYFFIWCLFSYFTFIYSLFFQYLFDKALYIMYSV